jgi:hypothetical protein
MNLLQFFFIISGIVILVLTIDISRKQKFNALHFLVFLWTGGWLLFFTAFPGILNSIWSIFWIARWADVLVYTSIVFLLYFVLLLLAKHVDNRDSTTSLIREISIESSSKKIIEWEEVFLIRAYNEWPVIKWVIDNIISAWYNNILVIDDGSTDSSKERFKELWDKIVVVRHLKNRGAWAALETGFEYLRRFWNMKYIINFDADGQHSIKDLDNFIKEFKKDKDLEVVLGSRFIEKTNSNVPFTRKIILFLARIFTFFVSWVYLTDAHNGYRVFTFDAIQKIKLTIDWMAYASEIIEEIKLKKIKFKEVPVDIHYTKYSLSKWQGNSNAINIAIRFIWNKFFR